jgi:hypothetical protein
MTWSHTLFKQNIKSGFIKFTWIWSLNLKAMNDNTKTSKAFTSKENDKDEKIINKMKMMRTISCEKKPIQL